MTYPVHPLAELFPLIEGENYDGLLCDIKKNGQLVPIVLHNGTLLDGRNRLRVCEELGRNPKTIEWNGECGTPSEFILSLNMSRRQMTDEQQTMVAVRADRYIAEDKAAQNQKASQFKAGNKANAEGENQHTRTVDLKAGPPSKPKRNIKEKHANSTAGKIAAKVGVSRHKVEQALKVEKESPELANKVISGEVDLNEAVKSLPSEQDKKKEKPQKPLEERVKNSFAKWLGTWAVADKQTVIEIVRKEIE
jgi:hypothetical protein